MERFSIAVTPINGVSGLTKLLSAGRMQKMISRLLIISSLFIMGQSTPAMAAPYYEGKVITIIVGLKPGGGYDRMARLVGKHLPKYVPGRPNVIIQNMDGADSMISANYVYNIAKPDGLTIGAFNQAMPINQLCNLPGIKLDVRKFAWLGSTAVTSAVLVIRANLPYKTVHELIKAKYTLTVGALGPASNSAQIPSMLQAYCGLDMKLIMYNSSSDVMLAIERNEVDARAGSYDSMLPFIERGLVRPIVRGFVKSKETEHLPFNEDLTNDKKGKAAMRMLSATDLIGRPFVCPPSTPAGHVKTLREAFAKLSDDPDFKAEARKSGTDIQFTAGQEIEKVIQMLFSQPPDVMAEFFKHVKKY